VLLKLASRPPQVGMPDRQARRRVRGVTERHETLGIGASRPGAVRDDDEGTHLVVDVASEGDDPGLVEMDRPRLVLREQLQLELFRRRERVNMVLGRIEVRKGDVGADGQNRQERMKLQVLLRNHETPADMGWTPCAARRVKRNHSIADGPTCGIHHAHAQGGRGQRRGYAGNSQHKQEVTHHPTGISRNW